MFKHIHDWYMHKKHSDLYVLVIVPILLVITILVLERIYG